MVRSFNWSEVPLLTLSRDGHDKKDPGFWIAESLDCLVGFEAVGLDACFVGCYSLDGDGALVMGEEACVRWTVGEEYHGDYSPGDRYGAEDDENVHYQSLEVNIGRSGARKGRKGGRSLQSRAQETSRIRTEIEDTQKNTYSISAIQS